MAAVIRVFYCYAPADKYLLASLEKQLIPLKRLNAIAGWSDQEVLAGTERDQIVQSYLNYSDLILLLISPDFLSVDFCYSQQMEDALDRHAKGEAVIIPIILRPVMWGLTDIRNLQAIPRNGKPIITWNLREAAFYEVAKEITRVVRELVEKHFKRYIEEYIKGEEQEALISNPSWVTTDAFRAEKRVEATEKFMDMHDRLKNVQMEIINLNQSLQWYIDALDRDEAEAEERESHTNPVEQVRIKAEGDEEDYYQDWHR